MFLWNATPVRTEANSAVKHHRWAQVAVLPDFTGISRIRRMAGRASRYAILTALRQPENYGLRGWIWTRSSDLAPVVLRYFQSTSQGRLSGGGSCSIGRRPARCFGVLLMGAR